MNETLMNFQKKTKVLSKEETVKLFKKARNGNKDAREKLICSNLGMVIKAAKECKMPGIEDPDFVDDMISDGFEELVLKIMDFDEDKNVPFSCYMWQWIKQWVYRKNLPQGISLYREEKMLNKTIRSLEQKLKRSPTADEISNASGMSVKKIKSIKQKIEVHTKVSLDDFNGENEGSGIYNTLAWKGAGPEEAFLEKERLEVFSEALNSLPEIERKILSMRNNLGCRYGHEMTLREVSEVLGVSREKVRYTEEKAKKRLALIMQEYKSAA